MKAEDLLAHYDRVADAPDAITKLRQFVLDLAVRGKLVAQDAKDGSPADALDAAREWLRTEAESTKRLRWKSSKLVASKESDKSVPKGWALARVNDTGLYVNGLAFKPSDWKPSGLPIIRIQNLTDETKEFNYTSGDYPDEVIVKPGDILVSWSATLDAFRWTRTSGVLNQHIFRVIPAPGLTTQPFLLLLLRNAIREMAEGEHAHGLVMTHINREPFTSHVILIPPLAEQERIVAKVDELMALCDRLEAARSKRESTRDRLAAASLARLNPPDPNTFATDARFALDALTEISVRPDQIKQIRQTILNLAVHGRLVTQDANDRMDEKGQHSEEKRRHSQVPNRTSESEPFPCPAGWTWTTVEGLIDRERGISYGVIKLGQEPKKGGVYVLRCSDVKPGRIELSNVRKVHEDIEGAYSRTRLVGGEVLINVRGTLGGVALVPNMLRGFNVAREVAVVPVSNDVSGQFVVYLMLSPFFWETIQTNLRGIAYKGLNLGALRDFPVPLPPLAEQHRIVAKVSELMALCDELEASLAASEATRRRLLNALLHETLEPVSVTSTQNSLHPRAAVSSYVVSRLASKRNFGRTAHMKYLYLAEARLGLNLGGRYMREAAGPLDGSIYDLEKLAEASGWYNHSSEILSSGNEKVSYKPGEGLNAIANEGVIVLGNLRTEMDRLLDLMGGLTTEQVEIIATLFAAWNDAMLDGHSPDDDWIVKEVREHWHIRKQRFTPAELLKWLGWMRQNDIVPLGYSPRTIQQAAMEF